MVTGSGPRTSRSSRRRLVRAYRLATTAVAVADQVGRGVVDGVLLGLADVDLLHDLDAAFYADRGEYVDERYNRRGLWPWERDAVQRFFPDGARVAVTGAGGGREVIALVAAGYDAVGYECNDMLRDFADGLLERDGYPGRMHPVARDAWPAVEGGADAAIVGWGSYMLVPGRDRRIAFLRAAAEALGPGTPVLVSFFTRPGRSRYLTTVATVGSLLRRLRGRPPVDYGDAMQPNYVHRFTREDFASEAAEAGFDVVHDGDDGYGYAVLVAR